MTAIVRMRRVKDNPNRIDLTIDNGDGEQDMPGTFTYWSHDRRRVETGPWYGSPDRCGAMHNNRRMYDVQIYIEDMLVLYIPPKEEPQQ